jgi:hypothetical protein
VRSTPGRWVVAVKRGDLGTEVGPGLRVFTDPPDEVSSDTLCSTRPCGRQEVDRAPARGEEERRVAGGCGAARDDDGLAVAQLSVDLLSRDT